MQSNRKPAINPRQAIFEAVEALELEAARWRQANEKAEAEVERLQRENGHLRQQLEKTKEAADSSLRRIQILGEENRVLKLEARRYREAFESESRRVTDLEEMRTKREAHETSEAQRLKEALNRKSAELKTVCQECETIRTKLERSSRLNVDDRSIELLHEIDLLRRELAAVRLSKDEVSKSNAGLLVDIRNLENFLGDREVQLRNETMRHSLLTSQFNSLMEENAVLKERQHVKTTNQRLCEKDAVPLPGKNNANYVLTVPDTGNSSSKQGLGLHVGSLPLKAAATPSESTERSSVLRRRASFNSAGFEESRGRGNSETRLHGLEEEPSQSGRNSTRRSVAAAEQIANQNLPTREDATANRSSFTNTLPLIITPNNGKQRRQ